MSGVAIITPGLLANICGTWPPLRPSYFFLFVISKKPQDHKIILLTGLMSLLVAKYQPDKVVHGLSN
ncbi:MAG: hypothetical protein N0E37_09175, partial [Candidatus Thiodiazotropha taylori]|nr:hypothetical protein [Candidatus Thiodiazotropha taylori]MCW4244594.1 hypothetical protein [Candidatus Thiodiazotropha taylori]